MRILGERVTLRDRRLEDFEDYRRWLRPTAEWKRWDAPWEAVPALAEHDWLDWPLKLGQELAHSPRREFEVETAAGRHIGSVVWYWVDEKTHWADLGIAVFEAGEWGRGLGREALALWTDYLFSSTDWTRVGLGTWSGNTRMVRLAERLGFTLEARFRRARVVDGERYDALRYGILREEWAAGAWAGRSRRRDG